MSFNNSLQLALRLPARLSARPSTIKSGSFRRLTTFAEGDVVLLREKIKPHHEGILTTPLKAAGSTSTHRGKLLHSDIIGARPRDIVKTNKGRDYRLHEPTLAEYVLLSTRLVTPIYAADANLIVSVLDLHVDPAHTESSSSKPQTEILEVGTGHGSLTLHLARAIHAANPPFPPSLSRAEAAAAVSYTPKEEEDAEALSKRSETLKALADWKRTRGAVLHTIDISEQRAKKAAKNVRGFRRAMYYHNVEFNVGLFPDWLQKQAAERKTKEPFLSHALIDIPNAHTILPDICNALETDGVLTVFAPSITQIASCVDLVRKLRLPLLLEDVHQLGQGAYSKWDVRAVKTRESLRALDQPAGSELADPADAPITPTHLREYELDEDQQEGSEPTLKDADGAEWAMICRPKVSEKVGTGGFLGVWRKMKPSLKENE